MNFDIKTHKKEDQDKIENIKKLLEYMFQSNEDIQSKMNDMLYGRWNKR